MEEYDERFYAHREAARLALKTASKWEGTNSADIFNEVYEKVYRHVLALLNEEEA